MLRSGRPRGFTLVELMVGVAVIALILGIAAPVMGSYLQNSKIASATQDYFSGVQLARSEAIRRNVPVEFVLTSTPTTTANLANVLTPSTTGANWAVRAASDVAGAPYTLVEVKSGNEGAFDAAATNSVQVVAGGPSGVSGIVSFNGFGGTSDGARYTLDISNSAAGVCKASGGTVRCRQITVTPGGRIAACDPAAPAADSRACQ